MKKQTRKELEIEIEKDNRWLIFSLIVIVMFGSSLIYFESGYYKLKQENQQLREQCGINWDLKISYYSTNLSCKFCGERYWDYHYTEMNFSKYIDYQKAISDFKDFCKEYYIGDCEVLK